MGCPQLLSILTVAAAGEGTTSGIQGDLPNMRKFKVLAIAGPIAALTTLVASPATTPLTTNAQVCGTSLCEWVPQFSDAVVFGGLGNATITSGDTCGTAVCWVGGSGGFSFGASICEYVSDPMPDPSIDVGPGACTIGASGSFDSFACGTGVAYGSATVSATTGPDSGELPISINTFFIVFIGGVGVIVDGGFEPDSGNIVTVGVVSISALLTPPTTGAGLGPCTGGFNVAGVDLAFDA